MKLYYSPGACSLSPHIVLREAGLDFQIEKVDLGAKKTAGGEDFTKINPKGYVPTLQLDDGEILTEGPAIVQYLADLKPAKNLAPAAGTRARYRLQEWLNFISTELHKGFSPLFKSTIPQPVKDEFAATLGKRFDYLSGVLAGKSYLMGDTFTVADAYLFTILSWAGYVKIDLSKWPVLKEYSARVAARPAVQETMKAERLIKSA